MNTVKLDKRGKILIHFYVRKDMELFAGQKFTIKSYGNEIVIKPYMYVCHWCGAEIPDGDQYGSCAECSRKNTKQVY